MKIPTDWGDAGAVTTHKNLASEYFAIHVQVHQRNALVRFDAAIEKGHKIPAAPYEKRTLDPMNVDADKVTFCNRVYSNVVAEWLKNVLDKTVYGRLLLKKNMLSFLDLSISTVSLDWPIMLKLIWQKI